MDYTGRFDQRIEEFFERDELYAKINRTLLGLEVRITIDNLMNHTGMQLVNQQGRTIDVHQKTVERYYELCSLVNNYTKTYGTNPEIELIKSRWAAPWENHNQSLW